MAFDPFSPEVLSTGVFQRPGRILIVDGDEAFRTSLAGTLGEQGHTVIPALDGGSGLKLAQAEAPDLALVEVELPDMSGFEVCRQLKTNAELRYTPVMLLTSAGGAEVQVRGMEAGANDVLLKPVAGPALQARVAALLKYQRAVAALRTAHSELEARVAARTAELHTANTTLEREVAYRREVERALRESEERYALAARGANDGLWDWNLQQREIYFSPRWKAMLGYEAEEISDHVDEWLRRVHPSDAHGLRDAIQVHLSRGSPHLRQEYRILCKDGSYRWMLCRGLAVRHSDGRAYRMAGSQTDITGRKVAEAQLIHDAFHDGLTDLANRALFLDRLGHALKRLQQNAHAKFAVLLLGLDRFKVVNDSLGPRAGNDLLIGFGQRLRQCLRPTDTVARLGGDEFAVLLEDARTLVETTALANSVHEALRKPFILSEREVFVTASVGIVMGKPGYERTEDLVRDAETAMHRAKAGGGTLRQETFHSGMHAQVLTLLHLENDLRRAIENQEFCLHYQPIISLESGRIMDMEALIRWRRPPHGLIPPSEFIPLAEETELITPITMWVLREACSQLRTWRTRLAERAPLSVSINVSGKEFSQEGLHRQIARVLEETGVDGASVNLEITEGTLMKDVQNTMAVLAQLKSTNLRLAIDDFGTGYSSLSYLHRLPIDVLKIDRSFVSRMGTGEKDGEIVGTIRTLAGNLGMQVVAEGVETPEQLARLRTMKCEYAQGFYFARPLDPAAAEELLRTAPQW